MSEIIIEDPAWKAIMADPQLASARRKLSFHEIRLIVQHVREAGEADRLREALQKIATGEVPGDAGHAHSMFMNARKMALAALQGGA